MTGCKGSKASTMVDYVRVQAKNTINVMMDDLTKEDRKEIEREFKEEMTEIRRRKLACF
jgi:hypothetical protein